MKEYLCIMVSHNEEEYLDDVLSKACKQSWHVLLVDCKSNDRTLQIAKSIAQKYKNLIVKKIEKQGLSKGISYGLKYALKHNFKYVATCDADGEYDPKEIFDLQQYMKQDIFIVIGQRFFNKEALSKNFPLSKYLEEKYGLEIRDPKSGARVYNLDFLKEADIEETISERYGLSLEFVIKALKENRKIVLVDFHKYNKKRERVLITHEGTNKTNIEVEDLFKIVGEGNKQNGEKILEDVCYRNNVDFIEWKKIFDKGILIYYLRKQNE